MGRRNKSSFNHFAQKKRLRREKARNGEEVENKRPEAYQDIVRANEDFDHYYKHQKICTEEEWPVFMDAIKTDLPTTFRVTGFKGASQALLNIIESEYFTAYLKSASEIGDQQKKVPFALPWYPKNHAWQLELSRKDIRRSESFYKLHNFLVSETSAGAISRQEAVSMIPPLVLDVKSHHKVLDMCAAPGSKTAQLIEALHETSTDKIPKGFVVANDLDNKRCYMLVHQAKRLNSPCFLVTNEDSAAFPNFTYKDAEGAVKALKFDRILCDVPCSGDGTLRKNPDIWGKWNHAQGTNLNGVQYRIGKRGAELLEIEGRLVYSTCSLNPVENEAVIYRLLKDSEGALEIVDASHLVPGLKFSPGMTYWEPGTRDLQFYKDFSEVPEKYLTVIRPPMFPPKPDDPLKDELKKCIRIFPHHQNTGAFFVACLVKKRELPWLARPVVDDKPAEEAKMEVESTTETTENGENKEKNEKPAVSWGPQRKKRKIQGYKEDPFNFFRDDDETFASIKEFYQLSDDFNSKCLLTRCLTGKKKNIYFCSEAIREIVIQNEKNVKIINTGIKSFVRCDNRNMTCSFRLAQEGLPTMNEFIGAARRVQINKTDLVTLLQNTDPTKPPELTSMTAETQSQTSILAPGSCVLEYRDTEKDFDLTLVGWRGTQSLRAYVDQEDTVHMLRLLGADLSKYEKNKFKKDEPKDAVDDEELVLAEPEETTAVAPGGDE